ncbi:MAG: DUF1993 domain-containing protein [Parcubacteria group bacterium]|nr:DUF1993 domain-containing protein [Parcubacteria group bacterium]
MRYPYYEMSVPVFIKSLGSLKGILEKAEKFAVEKKVAESVLLDSRLYVDMFPLVRQIQIAADGAKGTAARLAGMEPPKMDDDEKTFAELRTRLEKTVEFLETLKPEQFENSADAEIRLPYYPGKYFLGADYLPHSGLPNFFFHLTTAYGILRHLGVDIGKADYIGNVPSHAE